MQFDTEDIREHYASLSDEALLELNRSDLTKVARQCYDAELSRRRMLSSTNDECASGADVDIKPGWFKDAACVWSLQAVPGNDPGPDVDDARKILDAAGVPCSVVARMEPPANVPEQRIWELMVPGSLILHATSILDKQYFNPQLEAEWKTHFEVLSDEDLLALKLQDLTAGLTDRVERLTKTYKDERDRRGL